VWVLAGVRRSRAIKLPRSSQSLTDVGSTEDCQTRTHALTTHSLTRAVVCMWQVFGLRTLGRIQGLLFLVAAALNLLSTPIVSYTNSALGGDFAWPTSVQLVALLPLVVLTEVERCALRRGRRGSSFRAQPAASERLGP
jgi:hypothetical protein